MTTTHHLKVLQPRPPHARIRSWRAASLVGVHLLIIGHLVHYAVRGRSLSPAVMSETMRTLELGQITCGVLMFSLAIVTALLFGRFFCGWACHMGALQDAAGWVLKRLDLKPQPLRSRWLAWTPYAVAFYLFAWPTLKREALLPTADRWWPAAASWLGRTAPRPDGFTNQLLTDDFWAGLPRWQVAVPFLLICGLASVLFLGTRAVCRYICPYGGMIEPASTLAPIAVTVDPALCDSCGLCTKACDVGVRVMEETAAAGRIVSSRCVRSLDCIAVCPQGALSLKPARPAIAARVPRKARPHYTLTLGEEALVTTVAAVSFFTLRGAYDSMPLLMAVGISVCLGGLSLWTARLISKPAVSILSRTVKQGGCFSAGALAVFGAAASAVLLITHTAAVRTMLLRAERLDDAVTVTVQDAFAHTVSTEQRTAAARALSAYSKAMSLGSGGIGLMDTPSAQLRMAWLALVVGDLPRAESLLTSVIDREGANDNVLLQRARIALARGDRSRAIGDLTTSVRSKPALLQSAAAAASLLLEEGRAGDAAALLTACRDARPWDPRAHAQIAEMRLALGDHAAALDAYRTAAAMSRSTPDLRSRYLVLELLAGDRNRAESALKSWCFTDRAAARSTTDQAAVQLRQAGRPDAADRLLAIFPR